MAQAEQQTDKSRTTGEKRDAPQSKYRAPTVRIIVAVVAIAAIAVGATAFLMRDKMYDPANSYGTESPHVSAPGTSIPASR